MHSARRKDPLCEQPGPDRLVGRRSASLASRPESCSSACIGLSLSLELWSGCSAGPPCPPRATSPLGVALPPSQKQPASQTGWGRVGHLLWGFPALDSGKGRSNLLRVRSGAKTRPDRGWGGRMHWGDGGTRDEVTAGRSLSALTPPSRGVGGKRERGGRQRRGRTEEEGDREGGRAGRRGRAPCRGHFD